MKVACLNSDTETITVLWRLFCNACANGYSISGPILQSNALSNAKAFEADHHFKASNQGWLKKWKKRHNVESYAICGESVNVDIDEAEEWKAFLGDLCDLAKKLRVKDEMKFMATSWGNVTTESLHKML